MAVETFLYVRPDEMYTLFGSVAMTAGTVDADYLDDWVADGRPGRPTRLTSGTGTFRITNTAAEVSLLAACHHNLNVNVAVSGDVTATITTPSARPNGIPLNGFTTVSPVAGVDSLDFAISGNASDVIIGELVAGKYRTLPRFGYRDDDTAHDDFTRESDVDLSSVPPYDPGIVGRTWTGSVILSTTDKDLVVAWHESTRSGTRPSLIVPISTVNDAWLVRMRQPKYRPADAPNKWLVEMTFVEYPRSRW